MTHESIYILAFIFWKTLFEVNKVTVFFQYLCILSCNFVSIGNTQEAAAAAAAAAAMTCDTSPYGCCTDGATSAKGPNQEGCTTTVPGHLSKCQQEQKQAKNGALDMFIPDCQPNGEYNEIQCYTFPVTGKTECWCVDKDSGAERPGTRLNEKQPDCQAPVLPTKPRPYAFTICLVTVFKCCPDGVTPAKGPDNEGCPGQQPTTTVAPAPTTARPTVPLGKCPIDHLQHVGMHLNLD